jgi:hypothetical protein
MPWKGELHTVSQLPQLFVSMEVFTQIPLQLVLPSTAQFTSRDPARVKPGLTRVTSGEPVVVVVTVTEVVTTVVIVVVTVGIVTVQADALHVRPAGQLFQHPLQLAGSFRMSGVIAAWTGRTVAADTPGNDTCVGTVVVPRADAAPVAGLFCRKVQPAVSTRITTSKLIRSEKNQTIT